MTELASRWNGTLRFKQLRVPVGLASTQSGRNKIALRTLHRDCNQPLLQKLECPLHGDVPEEERVAGWEVTPGEFVVVETAELEQAIADGLDGDQHVLEALRTVPVEDVDPAAVRKTYYLLPGQGHLALKGYALILLALQLEDAALLVRFEAFGADHVAAIRPLPHAEGEPRLLLVEELAVADDVYPSDSIAERVEQAQVAEAELKLARRLVLQELRPLEPSLQRSVRREAMRALLENKLAEQATVRPDVDPAARAPSSDPAGGGSADLLGQLQASLQKPKRRRKPAAKKKPVAA